jgi:hypothetical protein
LSWVAGASQPLEVKVAEDHGRQKAAFYAGYSVGAQEGETQHVPTHSVLHWQYNLHIWARLLKQQTSITGYVLLTKENKFRFLFPFSVCSHLTEVAVYR